MNKFILYLKAIKMLHKPEKGPGQVLRGAGQGSLTLERAGYVLCGCKPLSSTQSRELLLGVEAVKSRDGADKSPVAPRFCQPWCPLLHFPKTTLPMENGCKLIVAWACKMMFNLAAHQLQENRQSLNQNNVR